MRLTIPSCLKMKIKNHRVIGSMVFESIDGMYLFNQYSHSRAELRFMGEHDGHWIDLNFTEEASMLIREGCKPFEACFISYLYSSKLAGLRRRDATSALRTWGFRPPTLSETLAIASNTVASGRVKSILGTASRYRAIAPVSINHELPTYYQFGVEGSRGSFRKSSYTKDASDNLYFSDRHDPESFRWPVLIGIKISK